MWKTIVVPHDFSSSANHAAALARDHAKLLGGKLLLLHVVDIPPSFGPDTTLVLESSSGDPPIGMREYAVRRATDHLNDLAHRLRADGVEVASYVRVGTPVEEILRFANEHDANVIVMGTHGRTGFRHLLAGSITEKVVRASAIPVLTTRHAG
jgi:nucleotide-binding universal stress UspA family protein